jgi:hypothetical protein
LVEDRVVDKRRHRDQRVVFWVTEGELDALRGQARASGLELSAWLRQVTLGSAIEEDGRRLRGSASKESL